ncbi:MAG: hypothetical protein HY252_16625 [Sphingobacteriales bacterium]|nr:hypothetical protein [Sphingobacteriales bacterium]
MRKFLLGLCLCLFHLISFGQSSIYDLQLDSLGGVSKINLSQYSGKMLLIVNAASQDSLSFQYKELLLVKQQFGDQLAILVVPTNSFNTEQADSSLLQQFYANGNNNLIQVSGPTDVRGSNINPLYDWLTHAQKNGVMDTNVFGAFQKYLVNSKGMLVGVYKPAVNPMDNIFLISIKNALNN